MVRRHQQAADSKISPVAGARKIDPVVMRCLSRPDKHGDPTVNGKVSEEWILDVYMLRSIRSRG
jgi:hypothetical protein